MNIPPTPGNYTTTATGTNTTTTTVAAWCGPGAVVGSDSFVFFGAI